MTEHNLSSMRPRVPSLPPHKSTGESLKARSRYSLAAPPCTTPPEDVVPGTHPRSDFHLGSKNEERQGWGCQERSCPAAELLSWVPLAGQSIAVLRAQQLEDAPPARFADTLEFSLPRRMIYLYVFIESNYFLAPCWACWVISSQGRACLPWNQSERSSLPFSVLARNFLSLAPSHRGKESALFSGKPQVHP